MSPERVSFAAVVLKQLCILKKYVLNAGFYVYFVRLLTHVCNMFSEIDIERCVQDSIKIFCSTPKSATFRQHNCVAPKDKGDDRPNVSYYSRDYHEQTHTELVCDWFELFSYWHSVHIEKAFENEKSLAVSVRMTVILSRRFKLLLSYTACHRPNSFLFSYRKVPPK
jgi:hypothetical protein